MHPIQKPLPVTNGVLLNYGIGSSQLLFSSSGLSFVQTGIPNTMCGALMSNGTEVVAIASYSNTDPDLYGNVSKTTDGTTWTVQGTISWPGSFLIRDYPFPGHRVLTANGLTAPAYDVVHNVYGLNAFFWAGALYVGIVDDGTNFKAVTSTDGANVS